MSKPKARLRDYVPMPVLLGVICIFTVILSLTSCTSSSSGSKQTPTGTDYRTSVWLEHGGCGLTRDQQVEIMKGALKRLGLEAK